MSFNPDKCEVLRISMKRQDTHFNYTLHGTVLRTVTSARYLGVHLAKDLKRNVHIGNITSKGNKSLGFMKRNLRVRSKALKEMPIYLFSELSWNTAQQFGTQGTALRTMAATSLKGSRRVRRVGFCHGTTLKTV